MATTSIRSVVYQFSGDLVDVIVFPAGQNAASPGQIQYLNLVSGNNTITLPTANSAVPTSVTIQPPPGNTVSLFLKAVNTDAGFQIHSTDPITLTFAAGVASFVLNAGNTLNGVRFVWG